MVIFLTKVYYINLFIKYVSLYFFGQNMLINTQKLTFCFIFQSFISATREEIYTVIIN